ncbi:MAG: Gfo/Idh/MocA family oxidoreductase [Rubrobacter sp.]|jgi:myo-inositol 2-dehydrogenase/D-chiro-inositol 1-dehydrogenase|nr:Gfo/Idh/MocA family oxidoreductase [Rubrobacter sp.]
MRVGVIGAGRIGRMHARFIMENPEVKELVVADADAGRAEAVAKEVGGEARQIEETVSSGLDAVVIAASTSAHAGLVGMCLDAGLPTFCEKPVAAGYEETVGIARRVESSGTVLQVGFMRRFDPGYVEARRLISSGSVGTIYSIRLATHDYEPPPESYIPTSGGVFRDMHVHDFDALRFLTGGEVEEVYATGSVRKFPMFEKHSDVDTSAIMLTMADGVVAVATGTRQNALGYDVRTEVIGSDANLAIGFDSRVALRSTEPNHILAEKPGWSGFPERFEVAYRAEMDHFLRLATGEAENPCTARDSLEALRVAMAADLSRKERRPVKMEEIR